MAGHRPKDQLYRTSHLRYQFQNIVPLDISTSLGIGNRNYQPTLISQLSKNTRSSTQAQWQNRVNPIIHIKIVKREEQEMSTESYLTKIWTGKWSERLYLLEYKKFEFLNKQTLF